jgi:hypothetical protein
MIVIIKCSCKNCKNQYELEGTEISFDKEELIENLSKTGKWTGNIPIHECENGEIGFGDPIGIKLEE